MFDDLKILKAQKVAMGNTSSGVSANELRARLRILLGQLETRYKNLGHEEDYESCEICNEYLIRIQDLLNSNSLVPPIPSASSASNTLSDMLFLQKKISEGTNSSGKSVIVDALFTAANTSNPVPTKVKIIHMRDKVRALHEFKMMHLLHSTDSNRFVRPYALLYGSKDQIFSSHTEDDAYITSSICIVMERGEIDMLQYINEEKNMGKDIVLSEKLSIVHKLLDIVAAAHRCRVVLLDFKLSNVIRVKSKSDYKLKAIDFENSQMEGNEVPRLGRC